MVYVSVCRRGRLMTSNKISFYMGVMSTSLLVLEYPFLPLYVNMKLYLIPISVWFGKDFRSILSVCGGGVRGLNLFGHEEAPSSFCKIP